ELDVELVTGQHAPAGILGDEQGGARVDHGQLHAWMRRPVGGAAAPAHLPGVANQPDIRVEGADGQYRALVARSPAHDHLQRAVLRRRLPDVAEAGLERGGARMLHGAQVFHSDMIPAGPIRTQAFFRPGGPLVSWITDRAAGARAAAGPGRPRPEPA